MFVWSKRENHLRFYTNENILCCKKMYELLKELVQKYHISRYWKQIKILILPSLIPILEYNIILCMYPDTHFIYLLIISENCSSFISPRCTLDVGLGTIIWIHSSEMEYTMEGDVVALWSFIIKVAMNTQSMKDILEF